MGLAPSALSHLESALNLFSRVSDHTRAGKIIVSAWQIASTLSFAEWFLISRYCKNSGKGRTWQMVVSYLRVKVLVALRTQVPKWRVKLTNCRRWGVWQDWYHEGHPQLQRPKAVSWRNIRHLQQEPTLRCFYHHLIRRLLGRIIRISKTSMLISTWAMVTTHILVTPLLRCLRWICRCYTNFLIICSNH